MRKSTIWVWAIVAAILFGAILRIAAISSDFPFFYEADEFNFVKRALRLVHNQTLDPGWYGHPGQFTVYLLAVSFALLKAIGWGAAHSSMMLAGRLTIVAFSIGVLCVVALLARKLTRDQRIVFFAVLLTAVSPLLVQYAFLIRPDNQVSFFTLLVVLFSIRITEEPCLADYLWAGLALGVAVTCKYPAVVFSAVIVIAHVFAEHGRFWRRFERPLASAGAALFAAFVTGPYLFVNVPGVLEDVALENRTYHLGHTSYGAFSTFLWYLETVLLESGWWLALALFSVGVGVALVRLDKPRLLVIFAAVIYLIFILQLNLRWERWLIPVIPLYLIVVAFAVEDVARWVLARRGKPAAQAAATMLSLGLLFPTGFYMARTLSADLRGDTRTEAFNWIINNVPPGSRLLSERYTARLPPDRYELFRMKITKLSDISLLEGNSIDYIVLGNDYDRRKADLKMVEIGPRRERKRRAEVSTYERLFSKYPVVFQSEPEPWLRGGNVVRVLKVR